jgi:predicted component of type VI protein secretion system
VGDRVTLGRTPGNTVAFPGEDSVSRTHAVLEPSADGWLLRDAGSTNGTFLNGAPVNGASVLSPGDEIGLGRVEMVFRADEPQAAAAPSYLAGAAPAQAEAPRSAPAPSGYLDLGEEWNAPGAQAGYAPAGYDSGYDEPPLSAPSPERAVTPPAGGGEARQGRARVRGVARGVQIRKMGEQDRDVLTFRVDRYDESGNRLPAVGVEFRDYEGGTIDEG